MKNHRFLWLRNRTTNNRKCEKARNIKEKRTIEMFNTASRAHAVHPSSPRDNLLSPRQIIKIKKAVELMAQPSFPFCCPSSSRFSRATLTASTTNAVKVQHLPEIAFSTSSITSFGKRIHLLVVGGTDGILNFFKQSLLLRIIVYKKIYEICIAFVLQFCF